MRITNLDLPSNNPALLESISAASAASLLFQSICSSNASVVALLLQADVLPGTKRRKPQGQYRRTSALPAPKDSIWTSICTVGNDQEYLNFLSLSTASFESLAELCSEDINSRPLR